MAARDKIGHALRFANRVTRRKQGVSCTGSVPPLISDQQPSQAASAGIALQVVGSVTATPIPQTVAQLLQRLPSAGSVALQPSTVPQVPQILLQPQPQTISTPTLFPAAVTGQLIEAQNFQPLNRSENWFKTDKESDNLKCPSKPATKVSFDDSLSLLEGIFPLNQSCSPDEAAKTPNAVSFDLDFDAEILSVLF